MMEPIYRSANNRATIGLKRRDEFLSKAGLARSVRPINSDAKRMRLLKLCDSTCEIIYQERPFHDSIAYAGDAAHGSRFQSLSGKLLRISLRLLTDTSAKC